MKKIVILFFISIIGFTITAQNVGAVPLPVATYNFDQGNGNVLTDQVNAHDGTIDGATWTSAGKYGGALSFNGISNMVSIPDANDLDLTNGMTIEAWVKPNGLPAWTPVVLKGRNNGLAYALYTSDHSNSPPSIYGRLNNDDRAAVANSALPIGQWSHIAGTYDGTVLRMYVNSVLVGTSNVSGNLTTSSNPLTIGGNTAWAEFFNGLIDNLRIYNVALSESEIEVNMNTPVTSQVSDIVPPNVSITSPIDGSELTQGPVAITADSTDSVGVVAVKFFVDGIPLGPLDTEFPYEASWDISGLTPGLYSLTAESFDGALNSTLSDPVDVQVSVPAQDFSFVINTPTQTVASPGNTYFEVEIAYLNGFVSQQLDLWVTGLPNGVTGNFLFDPLAHQGKTELIVDIDASVAEDTYSIILGATDLDGSGITHSATATLIVDNIPTFTMGASPQIQNIVAGNAVSYEVTLVPSAGFNDIVTLSATGIPVGVTATFSPSTVTPPGTVIMNIATLASTIPGSYPISISGQGGGEVSAADVTLMVSADTATWAASIIGSTGTQNNNVRVGDVRDDGLERVYVGTIGTGRMLEYTWDGSNWAGPIDVGGSPTGAEIHNVTIGDGRGDGQERIYAASIDKKIYEIWYDGTIWQQLVVDTLDDLAMHTVTGDGRDDGVIRLYSVSTQSLYEHTWDGSAWVGGKIADANGGHELDLGDGRGDGTISIYIASISSGTLEARFNDNGDGLWHVIGMGDTDATGDMRGVKIGEGRNDGIPRVYSASLAGFVRELSWNGSSWDHLETSSPGGGLIHAYTLPGRNDGNNRVYASSEDGKSYEFTWNGSSWDIINMGGGTDYMYGMHYGMGRNDGILRLYGADRGAVNRVYEYTWTGSQFDTEAPTIPTSLSGSEVSPTEVGLSWDASSDDIGVVNYSVFRDGGLVDTIPGTTFSDTTAVPGATYNYTVQANDGAGNVSLSSNVFQITLSNPPDATPPSTPGNLIVVGVSATQISLDWDDSTDNIAVVGYEVWRDGILLTTSTTSDFIDTTVIEGATYVYFVKAFDAAINYSGDSNTVQATATGGSPNCTGGTTTMWPTTEVPGLITDPDTNGVELGVKFSSDVDGFICGIRFYKGALNTGTHVGNLWNSGGTLLETATFINETASGWQQVLFANPVAITANTTYVASYHAPVGMYSADVGYFDGVAQDNFPLHALENSISNGNGVYQYGAGGFPNNTWFSSNYWVDVVFTQ